MTDMNNITEFKKACRTGDINQAKQLVEKYNIDIHAEDEYPFKMACYNGHFELVKYLTNLNQNINIHANNEAAFRNTCYNGHLNIVEYLISLDENINIHAKDEFAFKFACDFGYLELVMFYNK